MNFASTALLALAMSTDAFAAAVGKGTSLQNPRWREALRTGVIFGIIEAITPVVGWALGLSAASYVKSWDHWITASLGLTKTRRCSPCGILNVGDLQDRTRVATACNREHGQPDFHRCDD